MTSTKVLCNYHWNNDEILKKTPDDEEDLTVSEIAQKVARKELREDKMAREQCLHNLKSWLRKNDDVGNVRLDDRFLLRFLRVKKFSIPMAQQTILKYLNLRKTFPHMAANLDYLDPKVNSLISNGYLVPSPIRDKHGRRVIIAFSSKLNPKVYTSHDMARAHFITYETLLEDPENQILGFTHVGDFSGLTAAHITIWNPTEFARIIKWGEQSVPVRHKGIHLVNLPSSVKWILDFVKTRVSSKIKDRFFIYSNLKELHKQVDPACLPAEMGGKIPLKDMIESWKRELAAKRDLLLALDDMKLFSDRGIISSRDRNNNGNNDKGTNIYAAQLESIAGSFRKLEFD